ncbi:MAG: phosphotransferase family protein [Gemmatimonadota bacterium]
MAAIDSMELPSSVIDAIFALHGIRGTWRLLPRLGLANHVFATVAVVLRVATDHPEAVEDARTESVAAPAARAAGVSTPRLIAFDDTRTLVDRPFSLWERVHGVALGASDLTDARNADVWRCVGRELAGLHLHVRDCPDPDGYLDRPARDNDIAVVLRSFLDTGRLDAAAAREFEVKADELFPAARDVIEDRFIHNDVHPGNVMCSPSGEFLAIIDWGDAGWGDPTLDFVSIPAGQVAAAVEGYEHAAPGLLGVDYERRIRRNRLLEHLECLLENEGHLDFTVLQGLLTQEESF